MTAYLTLKLLHIIAMAYWLGGDLGAYLASRSVIDPKLSPAQRATALKIMQGCEQGPRLCLPLIFAIGFQMAANMGYVAVPPLATVAVWVVALLWFANANYLYLANDEHAGATLNQIDLLVRLVTIAWLFIAVFNALIGANFIKMDWLVYKMLIFGGLIACGIYIRVQLRPFVTAFGQLMAQGSSPEVEATLARSIARCRPAVYLTWAGIVLSAALGLHLL